MSRVYVAVDLETTGLNPERDAITEIGAVKFRGEQVLDSYSSLVNPGRKIPHRIVELTGITQKEADAAPPLSSQLPKLARFVGDLPVVGHNVSFDLGFLQRHNVLQGNASLDTWELARVLLPRAGRYSLGKLADKLDIALPATHRALDDAQLTHALFVALLERAQSLPVGTLQEIVKAAYKVRWSVAGFFQDALQAAAQDTPADATVEMRPGQRRDTSAPRPARVQPLQPLEEPLLMDVDEVAALLQEGGPLAQVFPGYEYRAEQIAMLKAVADTLNRGDHLLVEAGTGVGKSLAYLLPAVHWAVRNREWVVVSTNTINLQQQLIGKDVPQVRELLPFDFKAVVLKGRGHYLCVARLNQLRQRGPRSPVEARLMCGILVWMPDTPMGDRDELALYSSQERGLWRELSAEFEGCNPERCAVHARGHCFFYRARRQAESAHVIVVNHALLLSDIMVDNRVLPPYSHLIVDEAQHLENAATSQLSFTMDRQAMSRLFWEIGRAERGRGARGMLGDVVVLSRMVGSGGEAALAVRQQLEEHVVSLGQIVRRAQAYAEVFFDALALFTQEFVGPSRSRYAQRIRVDGGLRVQPGWGEVEIAWDNAAAQFGMLTAGFAELADDLAALEGLQLSGLDDLYNHVVGVERRLREVVAQLNQLIFEPGSESVCWISAGPDEDALALHVAPLYVGSLVHEHLFCQKRSVIMTSATLQVAGSFDFMRERLHAWEADELAVGSPFDYANSTLVYLVDDISEPRQPNQAGAQDYQRVLETGLVALAQAVQGRTMVLFTSYRQLRTTARACTARLAQAGITVLEQGDGSSRRQLLENFKSSKSVLMGTRSFWEGVDIPGEALSCLAIVRLPFAVPSDPVYAARAEQFDNPFFDYFVPEAVLRFLQGFGRLIRTRNDRGVVAVFDRRLLTKSYGSAFLDSLPGPTLEQGPMSMLPTTAARWIVGEESEIPR
jgi:DNA polymerase-3 subunit epsilon/ATP-dependent DNA helicase DinG